MKRDTIARVAKGKRPVYFQDAATDKLMAIVLTLVGELSVTRERLDAVERLLDEKGILDRDVIDRYEPDATSSAAREAARTEYIERVMRIVTMELQRTDSSGATESFTSTLAKMLAEDG